LSTLFKKYPTDKQTNYKMKTIVDVFQRSVQRWGARPFLIEKGRTWTYCDMHHQVQALRPRFQPHQRVFYTGTNSVSFVATLLATRASGAVFIPLSPDLPVSKQESMTVMAGTPETPKEWSDGSDDDPLALLLWTSGTTALPKGVLLSESNLVSNLAMIENRIPHAVLGETDRSYAFLPWCHSYGLVCELLFLMSRGASLVLPGTRDPRGYVGEIRRSRPTVLFTVPRFLEKIRQVCETRYWYLPSVLTKRAILGDRLRYMSVGGAVVRPDTLAFFRDAWDVPVFQGYGLTETGPMISLCAPGEYHNTGSCGQMLHGVRVRQGNDNELEVQSPSVCRGYLGPDNTVWRPSEKFLDGGWFSTGDVFRIKENQLFFEHRRGGLWKLPGGKFIDPIFLEKTVLDMEGVEQACLLLHNEGLTLVLWAPERRSRTRALEDIRAHLVSHGFQAYELPRRLVWLDNPLRFEEGTLSLKQEPVRHAVEHRISTRGR